MAVVARKRSEALAGRVPDAAAQRRSRPVIAWSVVGALSLLIAVTTWARWLLSGQATPTPTGSTPVPGFMTVAFRTWEIGGLAGMAAVVYFFLIRPWRREGRISNDGLLLLAFCTLYIQDPLLNYFTPWFTYNAEFINMGSWGNLLPGWLSPNGHLLAEPIVLALPMYIYILFGIVVVANALMRKVKERRPHISNARLVFIAFAFLAFFDAVLEPSLMRFGFWSYAGPISALTINHGHYYQYPVYVGVCTGAVCAAWAALRYFKDDRGHTIAERGVEDMRLTPKRKTFVRFLALAGAAHLALLLTYNLPLAILGLYGSGWPKDIQSRSYLTNGMCGPGTSYACSGPGTPIPRRGSPHLAPNGELVNGADASRSVPD